MIDYSKLVISIGICLGVGLIGSMFTSESVDSWYVTLIKPSFNPPSFVFAPVWTILYILAGVSLYLVWNSRKLELRTFVVFGVNLLLNVLWSFLFFGLRSPILAFYEIIALWIIIVVTVYLFVKSDLRTFVLLLPYLAWVTFASYLNYEIMVLNP